VEDFGRKSLLKLDDVTTYYGKMRILEGISIEVARGELICLLGGNASGKSTTLKTILGIVRPRTGRVLIESNDVTSRPVPERIALGLAIFTLVGPLQSGWARRAGTPTSLLASHVVPPGAADPATVRRDTLKLPFNAQKTTYPFWDGTLRAAAPMKLHRRDPPEFAMVARTSAPRTFKSRTAASSTSSSAA